MAAAWCQLWWKVKVDNFSDDDDFSDYDDFSDCVDRKVTVWKLGERSARNDDAIEWHKVYSKVGACCGKSPKCISTKKRLWWYRKKRSDAIDEFLKQDHREISFAEFLESLKELHKAFEEDEATYKMNETAQSVVECCMKKMGEEVAEEYANQLKKITFDRRKVLEENEIWDDSKLRKEKMSIYNDLDGPC